MRDIWVVSSLQLPGHVAEDGVSRCQWDTPSLGLYARTGLCFPTQAQTREAGSCGVSVRLYWVVMGF